MSWCLLIFSDQFLLQEKFIFGTWVWESARRQQQEARGLRVLLAPRQTSLHPRRWTLGAGRSPEIERDEDLDKDVDVMNSQIHKVCVCGRSEQGFRSSELLTFVVLQLWFDNKNVFVFLSIFVFAFVLVKTVYICCAAIVIWPLACSLLLSPIFGPCLLVQRLIATIETHATFFSKIEFEFESSQILCMKWIFVSVPCPCYGWRRLLYFACFLAFFTISNLLNVQM